MKAINFSAEMVRALLDGRKTQTRRVVKPPHVPVVNVNMAGVPVGGSQKFVAVADNGRIEGGHAIRGETEQEVIQQILLSGCCPYGGVGDTLYIREPWDFIPVVDTLCHIHYWADNELRDTTNPVDHNIKIYNEDRVRPAQHMPRWASRIFLKITSIRVERLREISETDCWAEGATNQTIRAGGPVHHFHEQIWQPLYPAGSKSWDANPWVWVIEFEVTQ